MVAPHACFETRGSPLNVQLMCETLTANGYEVHLVTYPFGNEVTMRGLVYHRVARPPGLRQIGIGFSYGKVALDTLLVLETVRQLRKRRFAAVHAVEEAAFFAVPLARMFRTPAITDVDSDIAAQLAEHSSPVARALRPLVKPILRNTLRRSKCALTVCTGLTDVCRALDADTRVFQIEDVPLCNGNGVPAAAETDALRLRLGLGGRRIVLYTGNAEPYQGVEMMIDALPEVTRVAPDVAILMVGGEPEQCARLHQRAAQLKVADSLFLAGKQPAAQMPAYMALADALISPRRNGVNTPLKIYSYMHSGCPIVATDVSAHTQVLDDGSAFLTEACALGLATGVLRALSEPEEAARKAARAKRKVEREYSIDQFRRKLMEVYAYATT